MTRKARRHKFSILIPHSNIPCSYNQKYLCDTLPCPDKCVSNMIDERKARRVEFARKMSLIVRIRRSHKK